MVLPHSMERGWYENVMYILLGSLLVVWIVWLSIHQSTINHDCAFLTVQHGFDYLDKVGPEVKEIQGFIDGMDGHEIKHLGEDNQ